MRMRKNILTVVCLTFLCLVSAAQKRNIYDSVMDNIRHVQWGIAFDAAKLDTQAAHFSQKIQPDGSWPDIDYNSHTQTLWNPAQHLTRLKTIVNAYTNRQSSFYQNPRLRQQIENALDFWYFKDPRSTNWWTQQIFCPKAVGEILILMRSAANPLPLSLENQLLDRMQHLGGHPNNQYCTSSSSNKINVAVHWIYRGCLQQNDSAFQVGVTNALMPVRLSPPALGIQYDYSYQEHGRQLYIGNYGYAFVDNIANVALYLYGTQYALSGEQLHVFSHFVRETYLNSVRGQYYSFAIPGRQIADKDSLFRGGQINQLLRLMKIDPTHADIYKAAIARWSGKQKASYEVQSRMDNYWLSDYARSIRPGYFFDVRMVSDRMKRTENVNHENKQGYFLSDGATNMTVNGDEYYNIFPVWDWCKVPGTTVPQLDSMPEMGMSLGGIAGNKAFVGGVSDSIYGAIAYDMDYTQFKTAAKKSWFFFDREVVCLGANIRSANEAPIATTVNQALLKGTIIIGQNGKTKTIPKGSTVGDDAITPDWVLHNGFAYYFPKKGNIHLAAKEQTGNWSKIATQESDAPVSKEVFTLWFDHGTKPVNADYAYIVVPDIRDAKSAAKQSLLNANIQIMANSDTLQAVYHKGLAILQAISYYPGQTITFSSHQITISTPAAIMLQEQKNGKVKLHIADPTHKLDQVHIHIQGKGTQTDKTIALPQGNDKGRSVEVIL